jgi:hypothetical protein
MTLGTDTIDVQEFNSAVREVLDSSRKSDTGKSLSEALIFATTNPQYDDILFIELQVQYVKNSKFRTWREHVVYRNCF